MPIPGLKDNEDWGISGLSPLPQDVEEMRASIREAEEARTIAIGVPGEGFPDVATLQLPSFMGCDDRDSIPAEKRGPLSLADTARHADKTVSEATFGGPRNYTQETAEWPGGTQ